MKKIFLAIVALLVLSTCSFAGFSDPSELTTKATTQITSSTAVAVIGNFSGVGKYIYKTITINSPAGTTNGIAGTIEGSMNGTVWTTLDASSLTGVVTGCAKSVTLTNGLPYIRIRVNIPTAHGIVTPEVWGRFLTN